MLTSESLTSGEPRAVDVGRLEEELSSLWETAAKDAGVEKAVTRACALTLLVYVENEEMAQGVRDLEGEITRQNPCRVIVMIAETEASPSGLRAWVSARCHLPAAGEKQICSEEVSIHARGDAVSDLDNVVIPLKVPGLPVYLWWRAGAFAPAPYFAQILRITGRVLVDSALFPEPEANLAELAEFLRSHRERPSLSDLNWLRIAPWRELIAQCFDRPESRPHLNSLTEVRIRYARSGNRDTPPASTLLLCAWLASRLKWQPAARSAAGLLEFRSGERPVQVRLEPGETVAGDSPEFLLVELRSKSDVAAGFSIETGPGAKCVRTRREIAGRPPLERTVRLERSSEAELVNENLKLPGRDRIFEEALEMVSRLALKNS